MEVRGRQRARAARPPDVGGVDAREGVRTPESSGTVAAHSGMDADAPGPREGREQARVTSRSETRLWRTESWMWTAWRWGGGSGRRL